MTSHDPHELPWQRVEIAAHHLLLIPSSSTPDLVLTYFLQLHHLGACASANMSLLLREDASILKSSCDSFLLQVVGEGSCRSTIFNQMYVIPDRLLAQIWKGLVTKIPAEEKIECQIIKHTNQRLLMSQSINCLQSIMLILLVSMSNKYQKHAACKFFFLEFKDEKI